MPVTMIRSLDKNSAAANLSLPMRMYSSSSALFGPYNLSPVDQEFEYQLYGATPGLELLHDSSLVSHPANGSAYEASSAFNPICFDTSFHGPAAPCDSMGMPMRIDNPNLGESNLDLPGLCVGGPSNHIDTNASHQENRNQETQRTYCVEEGCFASFSRTHDLKRHYHEQHNPEFNGHICGHCIPSKQFKRMDKLKAHMERYHSYAGQSEDWPKQCPWEDCEPNHSVWFCGEDQLNAHVLKHSERSPSGCIEDRACTAQNGDAELTTFYTSPSHSTKEQPPSNYLQPSSQMFCSGTKRSHVRETTEMTKRARYDMTQVAQRALSTDNLDTFLHIYQEALLAAKISDVEGEILMRNVPPDDFLTLCKLDIISKAEETLQLGKPERPAITFDISQEVIRLRGSTTRIQLLKKTFVHILENRKCSVPIQLHPSTSTNQSAPMADLAKWRPQHLNRSRRQKSRSVHVFAMRCNEDSALVRTWNETVSHSVEALLAQTVGEVFSVSLVRQGSSECSGQPTIRIQCPRKPSSAIRDRIRSEIFKATGIRVKFFTGSMILLAHTSETEEDDDEDDTGELEYPYWTLPWFYPGIGASVGYEEHSATLGLWLHIDGKPFALTVGHLINERDRDRNNLAVYSPAPCDVSGVIDCLNQFRLECKFQIDENMRQLGIHDIAASDIRASSALRDHWRRKIIIENDLNTASTRDFAFGSVECMSRSGCSGENNSEQISDFYTEWAVLRPSGNIGMNRPRYSFNENLGRIDFLAGDTEGYGAGNPCHEIGDVTGGSHVHFYGKTTGLQRGTVNSAPVIFRLQGGRKALRAWAITIPPDQQKEDKQYRGDSGASIIQDTDNRIVGLLFGCSDNQLLFTPMTAIIKDIEKKMSATVSLAPMQSIQPPPPSPISVSTSGVTLTSLHKSNVKVRSRRRKPNLTSIQVEPLVTRSILTRSFTTHQSVQESEFIPINIKHPGENITAFLSSYGREDVFSKYMDNVSGGAMAKPTTGMIMVA